MVGEIVPEQKTIRTEAVTTSHLTGVESEVSRQLIKPHAFRDVTLYASLGRHFSMNDNARSVKPRTRLIDCGHSLS